MTCNCQYPWPLKVFRKRGTQTAPDDPEQYRVHMMGCEEWKPGNSILEFKL